LQQNLLPLSRLTTSQVSDLQARGCSLQKHRNKGGAKKIKKQKKIKLYKHTDFCTAEISGQQRASSKLHHVTAVSEKSKLPTRRRRI